MIAFMRFLPMLPYLAGAAALAGCVWWVMDLRADNNSLRAELAVSKLALSGCNARAANLSEDKKSDATVDNTPDRGLRVAPDHWMLPSAGSGRPN